MKQYHFVQAVTVDEFKELLALGWSAPRDYRLKDRFAPTIMRIWCEGIPDLRGKNGAN